MIDTRGEVHVYRLEPAAGEADQTVLSGDERARAARFRFPADRSRFVRCRVAVRRIAGRYLDRAPGELVFTAAPGDKPLLEGGGLELSWSRCATLTLIAVRSGGAIGVDVEDVRGALDVRELAERSFTPAELAEWQDLPAEAQPHAFYVGWTRKEALLKGRGVGFAVPPETLDVRAAPDGWTLVELPLGPAWVGALAAEGAAAFRWCEL